MNLYENDFSLLIDAKAFFESNRDSDIAIYNPSKAPNRAKTIIFSNNSVNEYGKLINEIIVQKATINEAFWSGTIPKTLINRFVDFYSSGDSWLYSPNTFFISILEYDLSRDHKQMSERVLVYGRYMTLKATGYTDVKVRITENSMTAVDEGYIYFVDVINPGDMVSGVEYKLVDETGNWNIKDDVTLVRPTEENIIRSIDDIQ
ncbi:MAG TPA: hypothetical protein GX731_05255 [Clostridiales bacterium]|nr:hypothetical protein [Clostridiales bacterium]